MSWGGPRLLRERLSAMRSFDSVWAAPAGWLATGTRCRNGEGAMRGELCPAAGAVEGLNGQRMAGAEMRVPCVASEPVVQ
jgi:hypothetical protein